MQRVLILLLVILSFCGAVQAQEESCGPKSGLCWPVLKRGASGPRVTALQYLLRAKGFQLAPDGRFGFSTESAVRKFQAKNKLQVDGKLGWQSWEAITPDLKRGAKGDAVRALQTLLIFQKQKVTRDGVYGRATQKSVNFILGAYTPTGALPPKVFSPSVDDFGWWVAAGAIYPKSD